MTMYNREGSAPPWPTTIEEYVINQLARWISYKKIWETVTAPKFKDDTGLVPLDPKVHGYNSFRMRCSRVNNNAIAVAHETWQREIGNIRWGDDKARIQGLSDLIDKVNKVIEDKTYDPKTTGTLSALISGLQKLYEQVRKEVSADVDRAALAASGSRILLTNPKSVEIDVEYVSELLLLYRSEVGGLHNLDLKALNNTELEQLRDKCHDIIMERFNNIQTTIVENEGGFDDDKKS